MRLKSTRAAESMFSPLLFDLLLRLLSATERGAFDIRIAGTTKEFSSLELVPLLLLDKGVSSLKLVSLSLVLEEV